MLCIYKRIRASSEGYIFANERQGGQWGTCKRIGATPAATAAARSRTVSSRVGRGRGRDRVRDG